MNLGDPFPGSIFRRMRTTCTSMVRSMSLNAFSKDLGIDQRHAGRMLGPFKEAVTTAAQAARAPAREREISVLAENLKKSAQALQKSGDRVSARALARHMGTSRCTTLIVAAYRRISIEIGQRPLRWYSAVSDARRSTATGLINPRAGSPPQTSR